MVSKHQERFRECFKDALYSADWSEWQKLINGFEQPLQKQVECVMAKAFGLGLSVGMDMLSKLNAPKASDEATEHRGAE